MSYIRTKKENLIRKVEFVEGDKYYVDKALYVPKNVIALEGNKVEDLIRIGDLIVWFCTSSKRFEYSYIHDNNELYAARMYPVVEIYSKDRNNFKLVAANKYKIMNPDGYAQIIRGDWELI